MATKQEAVSDKLQIKLDGQWHKLSVTVRFDNDIEQGKLTSLVKSTIGLWCKAWQATQNGLRDWTMESACEQHMVEPCAGDPYVTVWNTNASLSLTAHSHSSGASVIAPYFSYQDAIQDMQDKAPDMFNLSMTQNTVSQSTPNNITPLQQPAQNQAPVSTSLNPFVRSTQAPFKVSGQVIPFTLGIEGGKTDSPNWNKPGMIAQDAYSDSKQYDEGQILLYTLSNGVNVRIKQPSDNMLIEFQTHQGEIAIWQREDTVYDGKTIKSDWSEALSKLGLENVQAGQEFSLGATYIAMKASKIKDGKQYKNFYGFFNAPESQQLAATGTEGKVAGDAQWLEQNKAVVSDQPDYEDIPY